MYLRHSVRRKNGRSHSYWRLVRSMRRGGKVLQETVAQLGELGGAGRANARLLAHQITGAEQQQRSCLKQPRAQSNASRYGSIESASSALVRRGMAGMEVVARAQTGRTVRRADA